jgi:4-hydroxybenzoate polyprenyltransferase
LFVAFYVHTKTKNKKKILLSLFGAYFIFFILISFPSWVVFCLEFTRIKAVDYYTVAGYFMSPFTVFGLKQLTFESFMAKKMALLYTPLFFLTVIFLAFKINFKKSLILFKNIRFPQLFFNLGILFIGLGLGWIYYPENFQINFFNLLTVLNLILVVFSSWFFSVFVNDFCDLEIDKISNQQRPLIKKEISIEENYKFAGFFLFFSFLSSILISPVIFLLTVFYNLLTWVYSAYPFRLRRFIGVSSLIIAFSSLIFLIIGFLVFSGEQTLSVFPWNIYWFLFVAYFLITPLKDLKDVKGDGKNRITTLPVLIGKKNTRLVISVFLLSLYLSSVWLIKEQKLFLFSLIIGVTSFYTINNQKISEKILNYFVLGLVFIYSVFLISVVF